MVYGRIAAVEGTDSDVLSEENDVHATMKLGFVVMTRAIWIVFRCAEPPVKHKIELPRLAIGKSLGARIKIRTENAGTSERRPRTVHVSDQGVIVYKIKK